MGVLVIKTIKSKLEDIYFTLLYLNDHFCRLKDTYKKQHLLSIKLK